MEVKNEITLKWGTLKGYSVESDRCKELLQKYYNEGVSMSVAAQKDSDSQRETLLELIDACDAVFLDWDGVYVNKEKAKEYILNYGKKDA